MKIKSKATNISVDKHIEWAEQLFKLKGQVIDLFRDISKSVGGSLFSPDSYKFTKAMNRRDIIKLLTILEDYFDAQRIRGDFERAGRLDEYSIENPYYSVTSLEEIKKQIIHYVAGDYGDKL